MRQPFFQFLFELTFSLKSEYGDKKKTTILRLPVMEMVGKTVCGECEVDRKMATIMLSPFVRTVLLLLQKGPNYLLPSSVLVTCWREKSGWQRHDHDQACLDLSAVWVDGNTWFSVFPTNPTKTKRKMIPSMATPTQFFKCNVTWGRFRNLS